MSTVPTDIATPPRAPVSSTADETDHDDLDRGVHMQHESMPSPPPTAFSSDDLSDLSRRVDFLSGKIDVLADTVGRLGTTIEDSVLSFFTFVKEIDNLFEKSVDELNIKLDCRLAEVQNSLHGVHARFGRVDDLLGRLYLTVGSLDGKIDPLGGRSDFFEAGVGQCFEHSDLSRDTWLARIEQEVSGVKLSVGCCWAAKGAEARERLMARWLVSVSEI